MGAIKKMSVCLQFGIHLTPNFNEFIEALRIILCYHNFQNIHQVDLHCSKLTLLIVLLLQMVLIKRLYS